MKDSDGKLFEEVLTGTDSTAIVPAKFPAEPVAKPPPFQPTSETSKAAAARIAPHTPTKRDQVLAFIEDRGSATMKEVRAFFKDWAPTTAQPRINELEHLGKITKTDRVREGCAVYEKKETDDA